MMGDIEYNDWDVESCANCHRLLEEVGYLEDEDELQTKWFCVGRLINKPENPNKHDRVNKIRMCLRGSGGFHLWEWTPFEASRVGLALTFAVTDCLLELQPKTENRKESKP